MTDIISCGIIFQHTALGHKHVNDVYAFLTCAAISPHPYTCTTCHCFLVLLLHVRYIMDFGTNAISDLCMAET